LTALRVVRFGASLRADLVDPRRVFSFFTMVAATNVLGAGIDARGFTEVAFSMWVVALAIWAILIYLSFGVLTFLNAAGAAGVMDGAWLNGIVGTQSLVILGAQAALPPGHAGAVLLLIHALWMIGVALYGILAVVLSYRLFFFALKPDDTTPLLWVVMGAAA